MLAAQSLLRQYNGYSRNNFPFSMEGVEFYAPLWQEDMQGSPIISYDDNRFSCAVTGALWTSQGRNFDNTDDKIALPAAAATAMAVQVFTVWAWIKPAATQSRYALYVTTDATNVRGWRFGLSATNQVRLVSIDASGVASWQSLSTATVADNTWAFIAAVMPGNATTALTYLNSTQDGSAAATTIAYSTSVAGMGTSPAGTVPCNGIVGEGGFFNRVLSAAEIENIRLATMWRYS